jgi:hypothetical protein
LVGLTKKNPSTNEFNWSGNDPFPFDPVYVLAQVVDGEDSRKLSARSVRFEAEGAPGIDLDLSNETEVAGYLPFRSDPEKGFATYGNVTSELRRSRWFSYWWRWETSQYVGRRIGPRFFTLTTTKYNGHKATNEFSWGPKIICLENTGEDAGFSTFGVEVETHLLTWAPLNNGANDKQKLEILNGETLVQNIQWDSDLEAKAGFALTGSLTTHEGSHFYTFKIPVSQNLSGLKLRITSQKIPSIGQEIAFNESMYKTGCLGWWRVEGIENGIPVSHYRVQLFADFTGIYHVEGRDETWPMSWRLVSECGIVRFYESGFWHPGYEFLARDPLPLPVTGFRTYFLGNEAVRYTKE